MRALWVLPARSFFGRGRSETAWVPPVWKMRALWVPPASCFFDRIRQVLFFHDSSFPPDVWVVWICLAHVCVWERERKFRNHRSLTLRNRSRQWRKQPVYALASSDRAAHVYIGLKKIKRQHALIPLLVAGRIDGENKKAWLDRQRKSSRL
jgi:hypothetical protein